jgi:predicted metal-dependent HD superfamily phosphohydrolase
VRWSEYLDYARKIRFEYQHVPREDYLSGRAAVLEAFLRHPRIYASSVFFERYEARARANVQAEIELLRSGRIPLEGRVEEAER